MENIDASDDPLFRPRGSTTHGHHVSAQELILWKQAQRSARRPIAFATSLRPDPDFSFLPTVSSSSRAKSAVAGVCRGREAGEHAKRRGTPGLPGVAVMKIPALRLSDWGSNAAPRRSDVGFTLLSHRVVRRGFR